PGCNEFEITPNSSNQTGSMHATTPVNLTSNFSLLFKVKFGCPNPGGEGMAFVMKPGPWSLGGGSYGLRDQGLTTSLADEFDPLHNQTQINKWETAGDHISLVGGGTMDLAAAGCLPGLPLNPLSQFAGDVEACAYYLV